MDKKEINQFFKTLAAERPSPKSELHYVNAYTLLVAVVLSAQSTDVGVNKATKDLFKKIKTPKAMVALGEEGLKSHIKTIGLFNTKAKNIIALSSKLIEEFKGHVPEDRNALMSLPGVGRKTANVVLNVVFGYETIAVDTHVFRVANRTAMAARKTPEEVEAELLKVIPKKWRKDAHHWLILHGRYVCKARKPDCRHCSVRALCAFEDKTES